MYEILRHLAANVFANESMAEHTSFKIGGPADVYVQPVSYEELVQVISECRKNNAPFLILGGGNNILVPDEGLRMVVIQMYPHFCGVALPSQADNLADGVIIADAGASLSAIARLAQNAGLTGLEFASGIPGTAGGAIYMNAGAYGHEIADVFVSADVLMPDGTIRVISKTDMYFCYRGSILHQNDGIVLKAKFSLTHGNKEEIGSLMNELNKRRRESQPLEYPSAGSTFKRPIGHFAGKLIEDCGLKGKKIGGAMVSEKHAGFIINADNATAHDVKNLIGHIQSEVKSRYDVCLEPEVKILCSL